MDLGFAGKTVVVTGAASSFARETALAFIKEGANVVVNDFVAITGLIIFS